METSKIQETIRIAGIFLVFVILLLTIIVVYNFNSIILIETDTETIHEESGPECSNLSFQDTAICLNDFVREIFIYNVTDDYIELSLEDLKRRGGDCKDYVAFYKKYMEYYGYDQDNQKIRGLVERNEIFAMYHVSLMSFDSTGYCHFDMTDLQCWLYKNNEGEVRD